MGLFSNLSTEGMETQEERVGGFSVFDSDIYEATIKVAYIGSSSSSPAKSFSLIADIDGKEYREDLWVMDSQGRNWYERKDRPGVKILSTGFTLANAIAMLVTGKPLQQLQEQEKQVNIYDKDEKKEVPKAVPVFMELKDKKIYLAIQKQTEQKQKKEGNTYVDVPGETRDVNELMHVFHHPGKFTLQEAQNAVKAGKPAMEAEPVFFDSWLNAHKGKTRDKTKSKSGGQDGTAGSPPKPSEGAATSATPSLFG
jgi:hypothetical protein